MHFIDYSARFDERDMQELLRYAFKISCLPLIGKWEGLNAPTLRTRSPHGVGA
jgi:hypothetical protein